MWLLNRVTGGTRALKIRDTVVSSQNWSVGKILTGKDRITVILRLKTLRSKVGSRTKRARENKHGQRTVEPASRALVVTTAVTGEVQCSW